MDNYRILVYEQYSDSDQRIPSYDGQFVCARLGW